MLRAHTPRREIETPAFLVHLFRHLCLGRICRLGRLGRTREDRLCQIRKLLPPRFQGEVYPDLIFWIRQPLCKVTHSRTSHSQYVTLTVSAIRFPISFSKI